MPFRLLNKHSNYYIKVIKYCEKQWLTLCSAVRHPRPHAHALTLLSSELLPNATTATQYYIGVGANTVLFAK
jgi:hypothetical protein